MSCTLNRRNVSTYHTTIEDLSVGPRVALRIESHGARPRERFVKDNTRSQLRAADPWVPDCAFCHKARDGRDERREGSRVQPS